MRASGEVTPRPRGGDRRSGRIEAEAEFLLQEIADRRDITLEELQAKLQERGTRVGIGTLWRFFDRRRISFKKRRHMLPSNSAAT
jgi:transposase